ncbi:hypothetical protein [Flavobacterium ginsengisoli]|uniref:hypothetical protein n=1 Tax=Flavobacterium ginsengisoli TaxID=871694 RepID=UPI0024158616|nr:hypothetical protein [Flavobacterium ginsengisoli]
MKKSIIALATVLTALISANNIQANTIKLESGTTEVVDTNQLQSVYDAYFDVKDALIKSDSKLTSAKASNIIDCYYCRKNGQIKKQ